MTPPLFPLFRTVTVRNPNHDSLDVRWSIMPTSYPLSAIAFEIFRSGSPKGPFEQIAVTEPGAFHYSDYDILDPNALRNYYYVVRAADVNGAGYADSRVVQLEHDPDAIALEMIRKKTVFLRAKSGVSMAIIPRKRWGAKCSRCWDASRMVATDADCKECFGTGYSGGYLKPVFRPGLATVSSRQLVKVDGADYNQSRAFFEFANDPVINPDDIIVDRVMNVRYNVETVDPKTHRLYLVSQNVTVTKIDENSIVYTIPIPEEPQSIRGRSFDLTRDA